jgi:hypothetical protein
VKPFNEKTVECPYCHTHVHPGGIQFHETTCFWHPHRVSSDPAWPVNLFVSTHPSFASPELGRLVALFLKQVCPIISIKIHSGACFLAVPNANLDAAVDALDGKSFKTENNEIVTSRAWAVWPKDAALGRDSLKPNIIWKEYGENSKFLPP